MVADEKYDAQINGVMIANRPRNRAAGVKRVRSGFSVPTWNVASAGNEMPGLTRRSRRGIRSTPKSLCTRNLMDSGNHNVTNTSATSDATPPAMNTDSQPHRGISRLETGPPAAEPRL